MVNYIKHLVYDRLCRTPALALTFALLLVFGGIGIADADQEPSKLLVRVNGVEIRQHHLEFDRIRFLENQMLQGISVNPAQMEDIEKNLLQGLIERELLFQESQRLQIEVPAAETAKHLENIRANFITTKDYSTYLQRIGLSEKELSDYLQKQQAITRLVDQLFGQHTVISEASAFDYYEGHAEIFQQPGMLKVRHILIPLTTGADPAANDEAKKQIQDIRQKLDQGRSFEELAKAYSQCSQSAEKGGDLGYIREGQMPRSFETAALQLKPGQVSDVVRSYFGYHLIKLEDHKPGYTVPFEDVKTTIQQQLRQASIREKTQNHIKTLILNAKIEFPKPESNEKAQS